MDFEVIVMSGVDYEIQPLTPKSTEWLETLRVRNAAGKLKDWAFRLPRVVKPLLRKMYLQCSDLEDAENFLAVAKEEGFEIPVEYDIKHPEYAKSLEEDLKTMGVKEEEIKGAMDSHYERIGQKKPSE